MSAGQGRIRVFRADDHFAANADVIKIKLRKPTKSKRQPKATPKPAQNHPSKPIDSVFVLRPVEPIWVQHRLVLTEKQKTRLQQIFVAPKALADLLRNYPQRINNLADASLFLLTNRKSLDAYINPEVRERSVDLLKNLMIQWSGSPPESIAIDFDNVSLTPDQKFNLPLDGFRELPINDPMLLLRQRKDRIYKLPFTLFEKNKDFYIAFNLESKSKNKMVSVKRSPPSEQRKIGEYRLKPGQLLPYITGMRNEENKPQQRVLFSKYSGVFRGGLKTMNWGSLSGWGVNGGLPSLGKRSR